MVDNATTHLYSNQNQHRCDNLGNGILRPCPAGGPRCARAGGDSDDGRGGIGSTHIPVDWALLDEVEEEDEDGRAEERPAPHEHHEHQQEAPGKGRRKKKRKEERRAVFQVASLNINGYGNLLRDHPDNKWGRLYKVLSEHRIGVLLVQETHLTDERVAAIHKMFARKLRVFHSANQDAPTQREGVAIVVNTRYVNAKDAKMVVVVPGRAIQLTLTCQGGDEMTLLCLYAPTSSGAAERTQFYKEVLQYYEEHPNCARPHLMAGDFNNVEDAIDRLPVGEGPDQTIGALDDLKVGLGMMMADGWRLTNPTKREYTFHRGTGHNAVFSRLDRIYTTPTVHDNARDWKICEAGVRTDHSIIMVQLTPVHAPIVGQGRPLFPLQLMRDKKLAKAIKQRGMTALRELEGLSSTGPRTEERNPQTILYHFKKAAMRLARDREKEVVPKLLAEIREHEAALRKVKANRDIHESAKLAEAEALTKQIRQLKQTRLKQQQQNSRATHRLYGDRPTKYWSKLHRECAPRDIIPSFEREGLLGVSGEKIYETDSVKMAAMARAHHMNVQKDESEVKPAAEREEDITAALASLDVTISNDQANEMGSEVTYEECLLSLRFAKNGSAPGLDGIPFEFWKTLHARHVEDARFRDRPCFDALLLLKEAFEDARVHGVSARTSFAQGWIAPIYKEKGERTKVVNYRPITLLNTDYKLLSKILAVRLAEIAPRIINKAQAGFVPGRKIHNHTQLARMMMTWAERNDADGAIVALDQEKAYDKIAHDYLWRVLTKFGIPLTFIRLVQSLYQRAETSIMINGIMSKAYRIYRGVRQGDPLSCLLFDLAIEPLSAMIRKSPITGFNIPRCEEALKAVLFADDTTVYLSSQDDFKTLQDVLDTWCSAAKARFNIGKTEIIPIGSLAYRQEMADTYRTTGSWGNYPKGVHVAQEGETVRILGAFFGNGIDQVHVWTVVLTKIVAMRKPLMEVIERWKRGHATVQGKRHVVHMIIGGMTQYLTTVQRMPDSIVNRLNKIIRSYLWDDRRNTPVGLSHVCLPVEQGGLGMLDLKTRNEAIDVMWLKAYLDFSENRPMWAYLVDDLFASHVPKDCRLRQPSLRVNPFLQKWKPKVRGLPEELAGMMNAAKRFGLRLEGLAFSRAILKDMTMWDHVYADRIKLGRLSVPSKLLNCLIETHRARTVGEFAELSTALSHANHCPRATCQCEGCAHLRTMTGCNNPHLCSMRAKEMIATLPDKWNPTLRQPEDSERSSTDLLQREELEEGLVLFKRNLTTYGTLGSAFRIFTGTTPVSNERLENELDEDGTILTGATDGSCMQNGERCARAGAGFFIGENHGLNRSIRLPATLEQSNQTAEMTAALLAATSVDKRTRITIETDSKTTMDALTRWLEKHENTGYILQKNADLTRITVAQFRMRQAHTIFRWVKGHSGHPRNEAADDLAALGAMKATPDNLELNIPPRFRITGARLQDMTQKLAYRAIWSRKAAKISQRPRAMANMDRIASGIQAAFGVQLQATIWLSLRTQHVSRQASQFMWMAIHDGYMIGSHWQRPNMSDEMRARATCTRCGELETMTHIIFECEAFGQEIIWGLLRETWSFTKVPWRDPGWGTAFGAACAVFTGDKGVRKPAAEKLWCILCTEAVHLIWKLRCERVIQREGREFTANEITNRYCTISNCSTSPVTRDRPISSNIFDQPAGDRDIGRKFDQN